MRHGFVICRQKAESRKQEAESRRGRKQKAESRKGRRQKAESRRKMALQTALWFLFAFCFLLFISQVYTEQSINNGLT
jgi:ABC-type Fe3+ transport system permease subunit